LGIYCQEKSDPATARGLYKSEKSGWQNEENRFAFAKVRALNLAALL
jgi:hypothetical protein